MRRTAIVAAVAMILSGLSAIPSVARSAPPADAEFQKVTLNDQPGEPMDLAVLPDGSVLHTTRRGEVWYHNARNGLNTIAATIDVYQHDEEGLQSIALDPEFGRRGHNWVYLYYSPPQDTPVDDPSTPDVNEGDAPEVGTPADWEPFEGVIRLSRFEFDDGRIDLDTEQQILDVPVDRGICCHVGGDILFDRRGNLYLSTGDDSNPFQSDGFAPIDERPERHPAFDAQRSAANTNDLRGKILRITPKRGGGYTIPKGNLFRRGTEGARPEIYAMGLRNPFRMEIDLRSGDLYVGDYSPDADEPDPDRGPAGQGRWLLIDEPANYGWPYCVSPDIAYVDYDFATGESGAPFDCANPVNESPNNTGLTALPPVEDPEVHYSYGPSELFPELETGGIGPMGGPAYDYDRRAARARPRVAWPKYYDGKPLFYEWTRDYIKAFTLDGDDVAAIEPVLDSVITDNPMDLEFGPDGALYMLEYGDGFFGENPDAALSRIDYIGAGGNHSPDVSVSAEPTTGTAPLTVDFTSDVTDADGDRLRYAWDFDADGRVDSREENPTHTFAENGVYLAHLTVTDIGSRRRDRGRSASDYVEVIVGQAPVVEFVTPTAGDPFSFGDVVQFEVQVTDDQPVECDRVVVNYLLGHDEHSHGQSTAFGCTGSFQTTVPSGHDPETDDLSAVFHAEYTDPGGDGVPPLSGSAEVVLEPAG